MLSFDDDISDALQGRNVMLSFDDDISDALQKVCGNDYYSDYDAMYLVQAAKVARREMFKQKY